MLKFFYMCGSAKVIKDLNNKAKELKVKVSQKGGRYIFSGEKIQS